MASVPPAPKSPAPVKQTPTVLNTPAIPDKTPTTRITTPVILARTPSALEAATPPKPTPRFRPFSDHPTISQWIRLHWPDILTLLLCLGVAFAFWRFVPPLRPRRFAVWQGMRTTSYGIKYGRPLQTQYVTTLSSAYWSLFTPLCIILIVGGLRVRRFWNLNSAIMGLLYALVMSTLVTTILKWAIGGLRPHFFNVCFPEFLTELWYTSYPWWTTLDSCNGDKNSIKEAMMSFPSGHASAAFAGFGFLALYLASNFDLFTQTRTGDAAIKNADKRNALAPRNQNGIDFTDRRSHVRLLLVIFPLLVATLISASKVADGWHHASDVIAGALIGSALALLTYKMVYQRASRQHPNKVGTE